MGSMLCEHCTGACCRYVALPLDKPAGKRDYDDIRWYLMHDGVTVFVEEGDWYVQFQTRCKHLGADNLCTIYKTRPRICREYEADSCDYADGSYGYDKLFTHRKQIEDYYHEKTGKRLGTLEEPRCRRRSGSGKKAMTA